MTPLHFGQEVRRHAFADVGRDADGGEVACHASCDVGACLRARGDADRRRHPLATTFDDPELSFGETRLDEQRPRAIAVRPGSGYVLGRRPLWRNEIRAWHSRPTHEDIIDDGLAIDGEVDRLAHQRIPETLRIGSKAKEAGRFGGDVVSEKMRPVSETVERLRQIGLEHGPRRDVDLAAEERLKRGGPVRKEVDLEPPEPGRAQHVALKCGERDAAGEPRGDGERAGMDRLARIGAPLLGGGLRQAVAGHDARAESVIVPALTVLVEHADVARR